MTYHSLIAPQHTYNPQDNPSGEKRSTEIVFYFLGAVGCAFPLIAWALPLIDCD